MSNIDDLSEEDFATEYGVVSVDKYSPPAPEPIGCPFAGDASAKDFWVVAGRTRDSSAEENKLFDRDSEFLLANCNAALVLRVSNPVVGWIEILVAPKDRRSIIRCLRDTYRQVLLKVAALSSNVNAFGLRGMILISNHGQAWRALVNSVSERPVGTVLTVPSHQSIRTFLAYNFEAPERLTPDPSYEAVKSVWNDIYVTKEKRWLSVLCRERKTFSSSRSFLGPRRRI